MLGAVFTDDAYFLVLCGKLVHHFSLGISSHCIGNGRHYNYSQQINGDSRIYGQYRSRNCGNEQHGEEIGQGFQCIHKQYHSRSSQGSCRRIVQHLLKGKVFKGGKIYHSHKNDHKHRRQLNNSFNDLS